LATSGLPVKDIEHCTCWENIQYSFLCMSEEQFELFLLTDEEVQNKLKEQSTNHSKNDQPTNNKKQKIITGDKYLDEIEKAFDKGDIIDVDALLKNL
jgi:hypothetical protein